MAEGKDEKDMRFAEFSKLERKLIPWENSEHVLVFLHEGCDRMRISMESHGSTAESCCDVCPNVV